MINTPLCANSSRQALYVQRTTNLWLLGIMLPKRKILMRLVIQFQAATRRLDGVSRSMERYVCWEMWQYSIEPLPTKKKGHLAPIYNTELCKKYIVNFKFTKFALINFIKIRAKAIVSFSNGNFRIMAIQAIFGQNFGNMLTKFYATFFQGAIFEVLF